MGEPGLQWGGKHEGARRGGCAHLDAWLALVEGKYMVVTQQARQMAVGQPITVRRAPIGMICTSQRSAWLLAHLVLFPGAAQASMTSPVVAHPSTSAAAVKQLALSCNGGTPTRHPDGTAR